MIGCESTSLAFKIRPRTIPVTGEPLGLTATGSLT